MLKLHKKNTMQIKNLKEEIQDQLLSKVATEYKAAQVKMKREN